MGFNLLDRELTRKLRYTHSSLAVTRLSTVGSTKGIATEIYETDAVSAKGTGQTETAATVSGFNGTLCCCSLLAQSEQPSLHKLNYYVCGRCFKM